jgi:beta-galactosidase
MLDICGYKKPNAFFRKSIWTTKPFVYIGFYDQSIKPNYTRGRWSFPAIASHLNFDHFNRRTVTAVIYTNCDEVKLWLNGKKTGCRKRADFTNGIIEWTFEYVQGEIEVIGCRKGKALCNHIVKTAGAAKKIALASDKKTLVCGSGDIAHIEVSITDNEGILCPNEETLVEFALTGDGQILGACSPDLNTNMGFTLPKAVTSGGRALAIIKAGAGRGILELGAYSANLEPSFLRFFVSEPS